MRKPSASFCPEGLPATFLAGLLTLALALLGWFWSALAAFALTGFVVNFFRDPERVVPHGPGLAVAPADGRVILVDRARDPFDGTERLRVCIFMNVFNVHVNRAPVAGAVRDLAYHPGKFLNASLDKASEHNERLAMQLQAEDGGLWTVVQIAGLIARRIVPWAEVGDDLARGQRFGMIRFGSRVDVYLPDDYTPEISVGRKTLAGQTVLARRRADAPKA